ncbi:MAG: hypothetical protein GY835_11520 [bacterium]|nr:hypothetical protein [bacterium]
MRKVSIPWFSRTFAVSWTGFLASTLLMFTALGPTAALASSGAAQGVDPYYGSFSTEIPIAVPGYHTLEPNLKLTYSSATARNSWCGVGCGVSGQSVIERTTPGGGSPRYDAGDSFHLDGIELLPCTTQGGTHCTRIQNYTRIRYDSSSDEWTVRGTNGNTATYAPVYETPKGTFRWMLKTVVDAFGNQVRYDYWCDGSQDCYLVTISYGPTVIFFRREERPDVITFATGAGIARMRYRLATISVAPIARLKSSNRVITDRSRVSPDSCTERYCDGRPATRASRIPVFFTDEPSLEMNRQNPLSPSAIWPEAGVAQQATMDSRRGSWYGVPAIFASSLEGAVIGPSLPVDRAHLPTLLAKPSLTCLVGLRRSLVSTSVCIQSSELVIGMPPGRMPE